ncbi:unnamed protein product [Rhodiola kirilowii]
MASGSGAGGSILREYRKGNWTLQETMILIEAKKMDDERRLKKSSAAAAASTSSEMQLTPAGSSSQEMSMMLMMRNKPAELRWKWVEDYCWRRGCFRSQNQCNDKWDNLMRDYKKVRDYQKKILLDHENDAPGGGGGGSSSAADQNVSYWNMDKSERKERGLPSNMLPTIYEALVDVVDRKPAAAASSPAPIMRNTTDAIITVHNLQPTAALSLLHQQHLNAALALPQPPLQQPHHHIAQPPLPPPLTQPPPPSSQHIPMYQTTTVDSDTSSDSPAKRRRKDKGPEITAAGPSASSSNEAVDFVANAISKAASKISEAIQASESRSEQRHREMLELNQRRMQLEEVNIQGTSSLVEAINNLANSILSLAAAAASNNNNNNSQTPPSPPPPPPP